MLVSAQGEEPDDNGGDCREPEQRDADRPGRHRFARAGTGIRTGDRDPFLRVAVAGPVLELREA